METNAETHSQTLEGDWEVLWKSWSIEGPEEDRDFIKGPSESTNLDPWGLPETEPTTEEQAWAGPTPP